MDFAVILDNLPLYLSGLRVTIELLILALICGLALAIPLGVAAASKRASVHAFPRGLSIACAARRCWCRCS